MQDHIRNIDSTDGRMELWDTECEIRQQQTFMGYNGKYGTVVRSEKFGNPRSRRQLKRERYGWY